MAERKRTTLQIERDRAETEKRYLRRETQASIGRHLGLSQQQVSYDLAAIEKRWLERALTDRQRHKAAELARIDHLEVVYWAAWERSCGNEPPPERYDGEADLLLDQMGKKGKRPPRGLFDEPDPRYLAGVQWCITERSKLLGLYAPVQSVQASLVMQVDVRELSDAQLDALASGDFASLGPGDDGAGPTLTLLESAG